MLSLTGKYALRAVIYLAQHADECPISGKTIAAQAGIPASYLSCIMGDLVRCGLLRSTRGPRGGFHLSRPAKHISLHDILERSEPFLADKRSCPFGERMCSDDNPCLGHDGWKKVREAVRKHLHRTSVGDVAFERVPR